MTLKHKYSDEIKTFAYSFTGQNEARNLIATGEWEKVKPNDFLSGYSSDILTGGMDTGFDPDMNTGDISDDWDDLEW